MAKRLVTLSCDPEIVDAAKKVLPVPLSQFVEHQLLMVTDNQDRYQLEEEIRSTKSKLLALEGLYCTLLSHDGG